MTKDQKILMARLLYSFKQEIEDQFVGNYDEYMDEVESMIQKLNDAFGTKITFKEWQNLWYSSQAWKKVGK